MKHFAFMAVGLAIAAAAFSGAVAADGPLKVNKLPVLSGRQLNDSGPLPLGGGTSGGGTTGGGQPVVEACDKPTVKALVVGGKVRPGGAIIIGGCGFGGSLGQAYLVGDFATGKAPLVVESWTDTGIGAHVPEGLAGAPDQIAGIQVVTKAGAKSNKDKTLFFEARRERKMITASDTDYECRSSEGPDFVHVCKTGQQIYGSSPCGNTVCQQHKSRPFPAGPFSGHDDFVLHLKNGYEYAAVEFWPNSGADVAIPVTPPVGPKPKFEVLKGGADAKLRVKWVAARPTGWVEYKLKIFVEGPAGVHYR